MSAVGGQCERLGGGEHARLQPDVGRARHRGGEPGEIVRRVRGIADFEDEQPIRPFAKRGAKRGDRRQRILPLERRGEVERDENDDRVPRQAERGAVHRRGHGRDRRQRMRDGPHPSIKKRRERVGGEGRRHPRLMHEARADPPFRPRHRQLPRPIADHPPSPRQAARQPREDHRQHRRIDVQHQRGIGGRPRRRRRERQVGLVRRQQRADIERPVRDAQRVQRPQHQPGALAQAPRRGSAPPRRSRRRPRRAWGGRCAAPAARRCRQSRRRRGAAGKARQAR